MSRRQQINRPASWFVISACDVLAALELPVSGTVVHALWKSGALSGPSKKCCVQEFVKGLPVEP
jgi:hypothetical protein